MYLTNNARFNIQLYNYTYCKMQDNAINLGLTATQGSYLVGLIGISNTVARVILGALSQKLNRLELQAKVHTKVHNQGLKGLTSAFSFHI